MGFSPFLPPTVAGSSLVPPVNLTQAAAGGGILTVTDTTGAPTSPIVLVTSQTGGDSCYGAQVTGDANPRMLLTSFGQLKLGSGAGATDITAGRVSAGVFGTTLGKIGAAAGFTTAASAPAIAAPGFVNGTASQLSDLARDYMVYLTVTALGTAFTLAIGPTSGVANTIVSNLAVAVGEQFSIRLPAGWFLSWSATTATVSQIAIGC